MPESAPLMGKVNRPGLPIPGEIGLVPWGWLGAPSLPSSLLPLAMPDKCSRAPLSATLLLPSAARLPKAGPVLGTERKREFLGGVPPKWLLVS